MRNIILSGAAVFISQQGRSMRYGVKLYTVIGFMKCARDIVFHLIFFVSPQLILEIDAKFSPVAQIFYIPYKLSKYKGEL